MRLAYLNTKYPSLSHTFVEREIRAARQHGVEVHTFSVRPAGPQDRIGSAHRAAAEETYAILGDKWRVLRSAVVAILCHPVRFLCAAARAQTLAPPGWGSRLLHLVYLTEGIDLAREMRRRSLTHVHVHMANNGAAVALLACVFDPQLSYSLSIHGSAEFFHVDSWCLRAKVEAAQFVRCISYFCRAQIMAWTPARSWSRFHIVHCGVDPNRFAPLQRRADGDGVRLLAVGRLDPIKGYEVLLQACAILHRRGVDWRLDLVGDGPMRKELMAQADLQGISDRISFAGAVDQDAIREHYASADVMVVSSFMEGVPVVLMEAMAMGVAPVATAVGGIPELIEDGVSGLLVAPSSPESLADAIARFAANRAYMSEVGRAARRRISAEFSCEAQGEGMYALFCRYLQPSTQAEPEESPLACPIGA